MTLAVVEADYISKLEEVSGVKKIRSVCEAKALTALRHQFVTSLARAGVSLKVAQDSAKHPTPELTANVYSHLSHWDTVKDVEKLPAIPSSDIGPVAGPLENVKAGQLQRQTEQVSARKKPEQVVFAPACCSADEKIRTSTGLSPTRPSRPLGIEFQQQIATSNCLAKVWASAGASDKCKAERQITVAQWLEACPVELKLEIKAAILAMLRGVKSDDGPESNILE